MKWKEKEERGSTSTGVRKRGAVAGKSTHRGHLSSKKRAGGDGATASVSPASSPAAGSGSAKSFLFCFGIVRFSLWIAVRFLTDGIALRRV